MKGHAVSITIAHTQTGEMQTHPSLSACAKALGCSANEVQRLKDGVAKTVRGWSLVAIGSATQTEQPRSSGDRLTSASIAAEALGLELTSLVSRWRDIADSIESKDGLDYRADAKALALLCIRLVSQSGLEVSDEEMELYTRHL